MSDAWNPFRLTAEDRFPAPLAAVVLLIASPTRRTAVLFAVVSWVVSRPDHTTGALQLPLPVRLVLLFGALLAAVVLIALALVLLPPGTSA